MKRMEGRLSKTLLVLVTVCSLTELPSCGIMNISSNPNIPDAWESAGFTKSEESAWEGKGGFALKDAEAWRKEGFTLSDAIRWRKGGFDPVGATIWKKYGFSEEEAAKWGLFALTPDMAQKWKSAGYLPENMKEFTGWTVFPPATALEWKNTGATPSEVNKFIAEGISPKIYDKFVKNFCKKKFLDPLSFVTSNPYRIKEKCSFSGKGMLRVIQFLGKRKALVMIPGTDYYALIYVRKGSIATRLGYIDEGLLVGEGSFAYTTTLNSEQVVPKVLYINLSKLNP
ncbi:MAG: hypothetical protein VST70_06905 [Nitrospirota bacterium]|nr:hypothetical protein [Nitrospirota bacterium]